MEKTSQRRELHAHVDPHVHATLRSLAARNDRSLAAEIRRAISEHVARETNEED